MSDKRGAAEAESDRPHPEGQAKGPGPGPCLGETCGRLWGQGQLRISLGDVDTFGGSSLKGG
jgi:hypothetical protein